jgi:capsid assembly protease
MSVALEAQGIQVNLMKAGEYKAMGALFKPLTDEERALFQAQVDQFYKMFIDTVQNARPLIESETMQGQCFIGTARDQSRLGRFARLRSERSARPILIVMRDTRFEIIPHRASRIARPAP